MNASKQALWLFLALIALACSGLYFARQTEPLKLNAKELSQTTDTIITQVHLKRFDESGKLINLLKTPEIRHIPDNDQHLFKSPYILVAEANQPAWEIRSERGHAINKGEEITFSEKVVIHQAPGEHNQESTMRTEELHYFPKQKIASTTLAVSFEQPGSILHSQGMKAYLADRHIQLLSNARATYEPKRHA